MPVTRTEFAQFQEFAESQVETVGIDSIEQLVSLWRLANRAPEEIAVDIDSIKQGIADADAGRVVAAAEAFSEIRAELNTTCDHEI